MRNTDNNPSVGRRRLLKGMAATGIAAIPTMLVPLRAAAGPADEQMQEMHSGISGRSENRPGIAGHVFASDPRAKLPGYGVLPG